MRLRSNLTLNLHFELINYTNSHFIKLSIDPGPVVKCLSQQKLFSFVQRKSSNHSVNLWNRQSNNHTGFTQWLGRWVEVWKKAGLELQRSCRCPLTVFQLNWNQSFECTGGGMSSNCTNWIPECTLNCHRSARWSNFPCRYSRCFCLRTDDEEAVAVAVSAVLIMLIIVLLGSVFLVMTVDVLTLSLCWCDWSCADGGRSSGALTPQVSQNMDTSE